jgi:hypothetical protein
LRWTAKGSAETTSFGLDEFVPFRGFFSFRKFMLVLWRAEHFGQYMIAASLVSGLLCNAVRWLFCLIVSEFEKKEAEVPQVFVDCCLLCCRLVLRLCGMRNGFVGNLLGASRFGFHRGCRVVAAADILAAVMAARKKQIQCYQRLLIL